MDIFRLVIETFQSLKEERCSALRKGEAVFGPTQLEPDHYFGCRFDTEVIALKERLQADELRAFHESVKARFVNEGTEVTADVLTFTCGTGDSPGEP